MKFQCPVCKHVFERDTATQGKKAPLCKGGKGTPHIATYAKKGT